MKIVKQSAKKINRQDYSLCKFIEIIGKTCYKSEISEDEEGAERFVRSLVKSKHYAMLEHGIINIAGSLSMVTRSMVLSKYFTIATITGLFGTMDVVVSASARAWLELLEDYDEPGTTLYYVGVSLAAKYPAIFGHLTAYSLENAESLIVNKKISLENRNFQEVDESYIRSIETEQKLRQKQNITYEEDTIDFSDFYFNTAVFICDRGVSHELVRHRNCAFAQESTRYCNYTKNKFGEEISVIKPPTITQDGEELWEDLCEYSEKQYFSMLAAGEGTDVARSVLPTSLKTEIIVTASQKEWQHIIELRLEGKTGKPHPQIKELIEMFTKA